MKLLVLCPHFAPDAAPTGEVMTSIADRARRPGPRLHVVTSLPWYQHHRVEPGWDGRPVRHEDTDWGRITRVHPFPTDKRNIPARALAFAGFTGAGRRAGARGLAGAIAPTPCWPCRRRSRSAPPAGWPPGAGGCRSCSTSRTCSPTWPSSWVPSPTRRVIRLAVVARALDLPARRRRHRAVRRPARQRGRQDPGHRCPTPDDRVRVIPNFVDTDAHRGPAAPRERRYRRRVRAEGKPVVMYAGNVGLLPVARPGARRRPRAGRRRPTWCS